MAPKRGAKRASQSPAEESLDKKLFEFLKVRGVSRQVYKAVVDALEHPLLVVPDECRKMLLTMIPTSLCVPSDERQEIQVRTVEMIGDAIRQVQAKLQEAIDAEQAAVMTVTTNSCELERKLQEANDVLAQEQEKAKAAKNVLADASTEVLSAKAALVAKQEDQKTGDARYVQIKADKEAFECVIANDLKILFEGSWEAGKAKTHFNAVTALFGKITLEESLVTVLPGSLMKKPEERGSFDLMAVTQLDQGIQGKLNELKLALEQEAPTAQEREAVVASAQKSFDDASAAQKDAASAFSAAQEKERSAAAAVSIAKSELATCEEEVRKAAKVRDEKNNELEAFKYDIECYDLLKEKTSKKTVPSITEATQGTNTGDTEA